MRTRRKLAFTVVCSATVMATALSTSAVASQSARQTASPRLTWAKLIAMSPLQIAALQRPLMAAATPLSAVGSKTMRSIYWGIALDTIRHEVDLYVTDPSRATALIAAAKRRDPRLDTRLIQVRRSAYSFATLTAASNRLIAASQAKRLPFPLYGLAQLDLGASLRLRVPNAARARRLSEVALASLGGRSVAQLAGVRLTFQQTRRPILATRQNDTPPFIGGDYLTTSTGLGLCTAGVSIENSSNRDFIITANHCFISGTHLFTQNEKTPVGIPYRYNANYDAELIDTGKYNGAGANADEGESNTSNGGIKYYPLTASDPAVVVGQVFCQDGIATYMWDGGRIPCDLYTTGFADDGICGENGNCEYVPEVETATDDGNPVGAQGDSGAVVFTVASATTRSVAGMVSVLWGNCIVLSSGAAACSNLDFVWWSNLYNAFGFTGRLNPHT